MSAVPAPAPRQPLRFYDTTLRDGLRRSGVELTLDQRIELARHLDAAGVDAIEVGFGGPHEVGTIAAIAGAIDRATVLGLSRVQRRDVDRVLAGVSAARHRGINIFHPASDEFLAMVGATRRQAIDRTSSAIAHAKGAVAEVVFATQDASRADLDFLVELCSAAIAAGATTVSISDTVSHAAPPQFAALCTALQQRTATAGTVRWSVHCHNEAGQAVANCLAAVSVGITQIEATLNGIGEGAGNAPLQGVIAALDGEPEIEVRVDPMRLEVAAALLAAPAR